MTLSPRIEPGTQWWEASALTTVPSLLCENTNAYMYSGIYLGCNYREYTSHTHTDHQQRRLRDIRVSR